MKNVLVIGGGPAGSLAATLLRRRGLAVTLAEQHRFPRPKVCGETLSAMGIDVLRRHGLDALLLRHGPIRIRHWRLVAQSGTVVQAELPVELWGIARDVMDVEMLDAAHAAGAEVLQPARVENATPADAGWRVDIRKLPDNRIVSWRFDHLVLADGRGRPFHTPRATGDLGLKAHFSVPPDARPPAAELYGLRGHYLGVTPVAPEVINVAMAVPAQALRAVRGDAAALWRALLSTSPALRARLGGAQLRGEWLACALPRHQWRPRWPEHCTPVGNAASAIEPIGGEGMGLALRSAELATDAVAAAIDGELRPRSRLAGDYRRLFNRRRWACYIAARALEQQALVRLAMPLLRHAVFAQALPWICGKRSRS